MFQFLNMRKRTVSKLILTALVVAVAGLGRAAHASSLVPVRLHVAGVEFRPSLPTVSDGEETYVSPELLSLLDLRGEEEKGRLKIQPAAAGGRLLGEIRLVRKQGAARLPLSELAQLVQGEVHRPARLEKDGDPAPVKPGDWVFLLARVRSVRVVNGSVEIDTSFPVPVRTGSVESKETLHDYVECTGARLPQEFKPETVPEGERRVRAISVEQAKLDVVRVKLELAPLPKACGPEAGPEPVEPLLLGDVLRQVQTAYPKLGAADALRRTAAAKVLQKAGAFDPFLSAGTDFIRYPDSDKPGKTKSFTATDASVELLTPYGIKVVTGALFNRGNVKSPLSLTGDTGEYFVGVKVPFLGGAGINEKAAALRQSRLGVPLANTEFDQFRLEVLYKAAATYWDWVAAGQRVQVARELLNIAQIRAKAVKDRAEAGDLPLIDVTEADQEVQRRIEGLEKAERDLQKETFKLSLFLWETDGRPAPLPSPGRIPDVPPPPGALTQEDVQEGRGEALQRRPELQALEVSRRIVQVDLDLARNLRLPAVELTVAPGIDTGLQGAGPTLKAGISLGLPIRQRTAEGRVQEARLKLEKIDLDQQLERQRVVTEVEDAASAVRQTYERYQAAAQELELARKLEQGERERFDLGDSTLFLVNQRERATAEAAVKVITIRAEYEQALALFRAVTAQL